MLATIHGAIESTLLGTTILGFGTSNGNINDYFYEFRVRADTPELLPHFKSASEDRERSVRYLAKDEYEGSLSLRKADEREGQRMIEAAFPLLYANKSRQARRMVHTMDGGFKRMNSSKSIVQHGLRSDLQPRSRGEGRRKGQADTVLADCSCVVEGSDMTGADERRVASEAVHSQAT